MGSCPPVLCCSPCLPPWRDNKPSWCLLVEMDLSKIHSSRPHGKSLTKKGTSGLVNQSSQDSERSVASMEADLDERMAPFSPSLPDWALPQDQQKNWPKIMNDSFSSSSSLASGEKVTCSGDSWEVSLDVANFSPDGLKVAVAGDTVTVSGSQETSSSSGENSSRSSSSFSKSYTLPSGCDPENVSSSLNNKGQPIVTCPRPYYLQGPSKKAIKFQ